MKTIKTRYGRRVVLQEKETPRDFGVFHQREFLEATKDQKIESAFYTYSKTIFYCTLVFVALALIKHYF